MAVTAASTALARWPGARLLARARSNDGINFVDQNALKQLQRDVLAIDSRIEGADTTLLLSAGNNLAITQYEVDLSTGFARVGGVGATIAALNDQPVLGTDAWAKSYALDGETPALLTADGKTYDAALCAILINNAGALSVDLALIFGDEADDGAEVSVTAQQIRDALEAAEITNCDPEVFLILSRVKIKRVATDTITYTVTAVTVDAHKNERLRGASLAATGA